MQCKNRGSVLVGLAFVTSAVSQSPNWGPWTSKTQTWPPVSFTTTSIASTCSASVTPTFAYSSFTYNQLTSNVYATPLPAPVSYATPFAPPFSQASSLLPANLTYTTYSFNPAATSINDGQYGQSAYNALWSGYSYNDTVPFTTTQSATPVPSSELVYPPPLYTACPSAANACLSCSKLPADFIWGAAGSAIQIEGGLQIEGRGPAVVDYIGNLGPGPGTPDYLGTTASGLEANFVVADMNYFLYKQDIARLAALGVPYYSFSISWTRIVPFGVEGSPINQQAVDHYDDLIKTCLEYGVKPIITLIHTDAPIHASYNDQDVFRAGFLYYAKQVMTRWAADVPYWVTINEPNIAIPSWTTDYNVYTTFLLAHADVYKWYKNTLKGTGLITLKFANSLAIPLTKSSADLAATLRYQDYLVSVMANPLFLGKQYPDSMLNTPAINMTALTADQLSYINGSIDFFSVDPYTEQFASAPPEGIEACAANSSNSNFPECAVLTNKQANGWLNGDESNAYAYITPQYVRQHLGFLWNTYRPSAILVAEFGFNPVSDASLTQSLDAQRYDLERTLYYQGFLHEVVKAVYEDGVNVIGTLAWSFVDNNEFGSYLNKYGMQTVNRTSGGFERHYKRSFFDFVGFFHDFVQTS